MTSSAPIKLTIAFNDPDLEDEERQEQAQQLRNELKDMDEVETVDLVRDPNPPKQGKGAGFLVGMLMAEVSKENALKLMGFLGDRLSNKPIELSVEGNGKKLTVKAHSREELEAAIQAAQAFVSA